MKSKRAAGRLEKINILTFGNIQPLVILPAISGILSVDSLRQQATINESNKTTILIDSFTVSPRQTKIHPNQIPNHALGCGT